MAAIRFDRQSGAHGHAHKSGSEGNAGEGAASSDLYENPAKTGYA
jgi:hypothetical protein